MAYGFLETTGVVNATCALDLMCKAAEVRFVAWQRRMGGRMVTVIIEGEISAVQEALHTACANAPQKPAATGFLANPHPEVLRIIKHMEGSRK